MATEKVGVYRKYHGAVPVDAFGTPLPKSEWPRQRPFSWAVRWFGSDGKRFSKSFKSRKEADRYAETKQAEVRVGKGDRPRAVTLGEFARMYLDLRGDLAATTKIEHERTLRFNEFLAHYHHERNHQGLGNRLIDPREEVGATDGSVTCRERLGGLLRYYYRQAA